MLEEGHSLAGVMIKDTPLLYSLLYSRNQPLAIPISDSGTASKERGDHRRPGGDCRQEGESPASGQRSKQEAHRTLATGLIKLKENRKLRAVVQTILKRWSLEQNK
eukprot:g73835.t1